jgi:hypothetical protein
MIIRHIPIARGGVRIEKPGGRSFNRGFKSFVKQEEK